MREILFRGQTRRYGEKVRMGDGQKLPGHWVYGGVLQGAGSHSVVYGGENENDPAMGLDKWVVYTDTLGQFTGLTDKNGKKIFEGDIILFEDESPSNYEYHDSTEMRCGEIKFDDGQFYITNRIVVEMEDLLYYGTIDVEVIGNIHDNPELLEVTDNA